MVINKDTYNSSVFINCPFDKEYDEIYKAIVFTVCYCGFIPRSAKERHDDSNIRIQDIYNMISECKYAIHDISYAGVDPISQLARFNMPYELGLFVGCKIFGSKEQTHKSCRILEKEPNSYDKYLSDIGGQDIRAHHNNPEEAAKHVRDFLAAKTKRITIPSPSIVWKGYCKYQKALPRMASKLGLKAEELTPRETIELIYTWVSKNITLAS